jgi:hypothetical protein
VWRAVMLATLVVSLATAAPAWAAQSIAARPNPVRFGEKLVVKGRGWPVNEFCSRTVRISLRSRQNAFRIGTTHTTRRGRFRLEWVPRRRRVGAGDWRLVARMRCESGRDGSPVPVRASEPLRIGGSGNFIVGRGVTTKSRWALYVRRGRLGGFCVGLLVGPLDRSRSGSSGETCGGGVRRKAITFGLSYARHRGTFAYGMLAPHVARVVARFGDQGPWEARVMPSPPALGFAGRFWIAPFDGSCDVVSVEALDAAGTSLARIDFGTPRGAPGTEPARCLS